MKKEKKSIMDRLLDVSMKIQANTYIKAISSGFAALMPLIIVGAIFAVVDSIGIGVYQDFLVDTGIKDFMKFPNMVTNGMLSIYVAFSIAYNLATLHKLDAFMTGLVSIMAFLVLQPFSVNAEGVDVIRVGLLGAEGVFTAIIVAILVFECSRFLIKHNIYIKMPAGVPEMVERSFKALTSVALVMLLFLIVKIGFSFTSYGTFPDLITALVQAPLKSLGSNFFSFVIIIVIVNLLWFFGIHGHLVALSIMTPVYIQMDLENLTNFQTGAPMENILGNSFIYIYCSGFCVLAGLVFWLWRAKTQRFKSIAKLSLVPSIFGIGEPLCFGVPYVFNFTLFIPVVFSGAINAVLAYAATAMDLLPKLNGLNISGVPVGIGGFLAGGFAVGAFQLVLCAINILVYAPFMKRLDQAEYEKEQAEMKAAAVQE